MDYTKATVDDWRGWLQEERIRLSVLEDVTSGRLPITNEKLKEACKIEAIKLRLLDEDVDGKRPTGA